MGRRLHESSAMQKITVGEFSIELLFDQRSDGRYFIHSPHVPGLRLAGPDLEALCADIEPAVKDLLRHNRDFAVESIRWVPSIDEVLEQFDLPAQIEKRATYVVRLSGAA